MAWHICHIFYLYILPKIYHTFDILAIFQKHWNQRGQDRIRSNVITLEGYNGWWRAQNWWLPRVGKNLVDAPISCCCAQSRMWPLGIVYLLFCYVCQYAYPQHSSWRRRLLTGVLWLRHDLCFILLCGFHANGLGHDLETSQKRRSFHRPWSSEHRSSYYWTRWSQLLVQSGLLRHYWPLYFRVWNSHGYHSCDARDPWRNRIKQGLGYYYYWLEGTI